MTKAMVFLACAVFAQACSKTEEPKAEAKCGTGTVLKDGKCVAEEKMKFAMPQACEELKATIVGCEASSAEDRKAMLDSIQKAYDSGESIVQLEELCRRQNQKVSEACAAAKAAGVAPDQ